MNKKFKILIIILILILIPVVYFTATTVSNQMEQDNFYETIKNVSNAENKSDKLIAEYIQNNSNNYTFSMDNYNQTIKTMDDSINTLKDLNKSLHNETLKEYVNLEITRIEDEKTQWKIIPEEIEVLENYYHGKSSFSESYQKIKELNDEINKTGTIVVHDKEKAEEFLEDHPDIKTRFEKLGIDEDFRIVENAEVDKKIAKSKK